jgi:hypothetical protein
VVAAVTAVALAAGVAVAAVGEMGEAEAVVAVPGEREAADTEGQVEGAERVVVRRRLNRKFPVGDQWLPVLPLQINQRAQVRGILLDSRWLVQRGRLGLGEIRAVT